MTEFDKAAYIEAEPWLEDPYLVIPPGTKVCKCCEENWYSTWFMSDQNFVDNKLPVCSFCLNSRGDHKGKSRAILNETGIEYKCSKCGCNKMLGEFSFDYKVGKVSGSCAECTRERFRSAGLR